MYPTHGYNTTKHAGCEASGSLIQPSNSRCRQKHLPGVQHRCALKRQHTVELLIVGSNANNGSQCGLSYANSNNAFSNSNDNIGARLKIYTIKRKRRCSPRYGLVTRLSLTRWRDIPTEQRQEALGMRGYAPTKSRCASKQGSCTPIPKAR